MQPNGHWSQINVMFFLIVRRIPYELNGKLSVIKVPYTLRNVNILIYIGAPLHRILTGFFAMFCENLLKDH